MNKKIVILLIVFLIGGKIFSQDKVFSEGEELNYVVYYGFIKLGEVKMILSGKTEENGEIIYRAKSTMKSYSGIPFVSLNSVFETEMVFDGKDVFSRKFKAIEKKEDGEIVIEYNFHYDSDFVHVRKDNLGKTELDKDIKFNKNVKFQDGLSLFYEARLNSFSKDNSIIPVFMNENETSVSYYFSSKPEEISISAFDDDQNAIRCNGNANFTGVFGLTGEFAGWFSNDPARIPLKSLLNVVIGNVTLELDSYKRNDWKPGR